jgi:hypothetical protein
MYLIYAADGEIVDVLGWRGESGSGLRRLHYGVFDVAEAMGRFVMRVKSVGVKTLTRSLEWGAEDGDWIFGARFVPGSN